MSHEFNMFLMYEKTERMLNKKDCYNLTGSYDWEFNL